MKREIGNYWVKFKISSNPYRNDDWEIFKWRGDSWWDGESSWADEDIVVIDENLILDPSQKAKYVISDEEIAKEAKWRFTDGHGAEDTYSIDIFINCAKWMKAQQILNIKQILTDYENKRQFLRGSVEWMIDQFLNDENNGEK
jgi:hypothetical protein